MANEKYFHIKNFMAKGTSEKEFEAYREEKNVK
jgi:hypothetical protein